MAEDTSTQVSKATVTREEFSDAMAHIAELQSVTRRVAKLERERIPTDELETPTGTVYLSSQKTLVSGTATTSQSWSNLPIANDVPADAKEIILWCGTTDASNGSGLSVMRYRSGSYVSPICEQRGSLTGDTQNNMSQVRLPVVGASAEYEIELNGGATTFPYRIDLVGYIV